MIAGLGMMTEVAITGAIFYLIHDIIVKTNLFMVSGVIYKIKANHNIRKLGDFYAESSKNELIVCNSFILSGGDSTTFRILA